MSGKNLSAVVAAIVLCIPIAKLFAAAATQPSPPAALVTPNAAAFLDDDDDDKPKPPAGQGGTANSTRYFFGLLDSRSSYGHDFFPDLFLGPEFDKETQLEVDYGHSEADGQQDDEADAEIDWNPIGDLTLAAEVGWEHVHEGDDDDEESGSGVESVDLAAYHPIFQYVSPSGFFDYTAVTRLDVAIPTRSPVAGDDAQLTPYVAHLIRLGDHISIESWAGTLFPIQPHPVDTFIYGASFGYLIPRSQLPLPLTDSFMPMFELDGTNPFSGPGQDALIGVAGIHWDLSDIGDAQPSFGIGYEFPMDEGAREQLRWGIISQFFVDF